MDGAVFFGMVSYTGHDDHVEDGRRERRSRVCDGGGKQIMRTRVRYYSIIQCIIYYDVVPFTYLPLFDSTGNRENSRTPCPVGLSVLFVGRACAA